MTPYIKDVRYNLTLDMTPAVFAAMTNTGKNSVHGDSSITLKADNHSVVRWTSLIYRPVFALYVYTLKLHLITWIILFSNLCQRPSNATHMSWLVCVFTGGV